METIDGVFASPDAAVRAAAHLREVIRRRSNVRVFVPGKNRTVVEWVVADDNRSFVDATILALGISLFGSLTLAAYGARPLDVVMWLFCGLAGGLTLALWLTGEHHTRRTLHVHAPPRTRFEREASAGHAIVIVLVSSQTEAEKVLRVVRTTGGHIVNGLFAARALTPAFVSGVARSG